MMLATLDRAAKAKSITNMTRSRVEIFNRRTSEMGRTTRIMSKATAKAPVAYVMPTTSRHWPTINLFQMDSMGLHWKARRQKKMRLPATMITIHTWQATRNQTLPSNMCR